MKIAVVSSIFIPGLGYLEEGLTRVLTGMGHSVSVLTSFHYPFNIQKKHRTPLSGDQPIILRNTDFTYRIKRLKTFLKLRSNIICYGLREAVLSINPDLIILVGISDFFPIRLINRKFSTQFNIYAFIGQNYDMGHWRKSNSPLERSYSYFINYLVKGFLYRKSICYLSKIIFYTPDSEEIISKLLPSRLLPCLHEKKINITLGFNSEDFYFVPDSRNLIRNRLKINSKQIVFITVTRVERSKKILEIIHSLFLINKLDVVYFIIGFIDNTYKKEIKNLIQVNKLQTKIFCFPFLSNDSVIDYLSAADFGIWLQSGASIQQAMGTGLPVILPGNTTTAMLLEEGLNGYYINNDLNETICKALSSYSYNIRKRKEIELFNKSRFSYQSILQDIL